MEVETACHPPGHSSLIKFLVKMALQATINFFGVDDLDLRGMLMQ
jgi:hypothetical protein